jgi:hypothetical protein
VLDVAAAPGLRRQVDSLGRAADEHDLLRRRCVDEPARLAARRLVGLSGAALFVVAMAAGMALFAALPAIRELTSATATLEDG